MAPFAGLLEEVEPLYDLPHDNLAGDVLIPATSIADEIMVASGFFSSGALAKIAPGLAPAIAARASIRLLLSPDLADEDWDAIRRGVREPEQTVRDVVERLLLEASVSAAALEHHTLDCLAFLVASQHIEIRFVLQPRGMYHKKQWLIRCGDERLAIHGSGNTTLPGLFVNGEQMSIERGWADGARAERRITQLWEQFDRDWTGRRPNAITVGADSAVALLGALVPDSSDRRAPTVADFWAAWRRDHAAGRAVPLPIGFIDAPRRLMVPDGLEWQTGHYAHQARGVMAFLEHHRGTLAIATGGGKTKTALIAATLVQDEQTISPFLLVVLVPSDPLVRQWADEVRCFGIQPTVLGGSHVGTQLAGVEAAINAGGGRTEVIVASKQLWVRNRRFRELIDRVSERARPMLIADEAHNFGAHAFITNPPQGFVTRLGLSATPIRQYDLDGTTALFDYLGPQIFEFGLAEAIDAGCLVPYDYVIHEVTLTDEELSAVRDITDQLYRAGFRIDDDGRAVIPNATVERLLRQRRAVLEQAEAKLDALRDALSAGSVHRTLIYCSPKELVVATERQITLVNRMLSSLGIVSHSLTSEETASGRSTDILRRFADGQYQVLTAMKVLDEGVDVPATETAYLLASTTVEREWVQRRGRVLRTAPNKTSATIHDFVVVPAQLDDTGRSVLRGELRRLRAFADTARNRYQPGGALDVIESLQQLVQGESRQ